MIRGTVNKYDSKEFLSTLTIPDHLWVKTKLGTKVFVINVPHRVTNINYHQFCCTICTENGNVLRKIPLSSFSSKDIDAIHASSNYCEKKFQKYLSTVDQKNLDKKTVFIRNFMTSTPVIWSDNMVGDISTGGSSSFELYNEVSPPDLR